MSKKLYYRYGAMNSGKSTSLLQAAYNYEERGQKVIIAKPTIDTKDEAVLSRLGVARKVDLHVEPETNVYKEFEVLASEATNAGSRIDCLIVDEAQFFTRSQVNDLFMIAVQLNVPVLAYGIRSDFQGNAFPGSMRLLELAHSLEEMKTICRCGQKALFNGRKIAGEYVRSGGQVAIDDGSVEYESLCGQCYITNVGPLN
jgi:thymidine kinase